MSNKIQLVGGYDLPERFDSNVAYQLLPKNFDLAYYTERVNRNIGWITGEEQEMIHRSVIGVAGCGGMGGQLAEKFLRLGVGEIRIADNETFDVSNINRQFAATRLTVGRSKAIETAKMMRDVVDDSTLVVYPQGIREDTTFDFIRGCVVVCDEIELWCVGSRILLHRVAREIGVPVFVCNSLGFGSQLFLFTPRSMTMEECLGMEYDEAKSLQAKINDRSANKAEIIRVMEATTRGLCFEWPEYCVEESLVKNKVLTRERLVKEGRGAVIATNPSLACGFAADRVALHLLEKSSVKRDIVEIPEMPGYLYLDAAKMEAKTVRGRWW